MKKYAKILALGLCSLLAFSVFAGCGDGGNAGTNEEPGQPSEKDPDAETPVTPDKEAPALTDAALTLSLTGSVHPDRAEDTISSELFGLFLEDINYASFAMDDNLLANGSFDTDEATRWVNGAGAGYTRKTGADKLTETNPYYAEVNVSAAGGKLVNNGYHFVPMYIQKNKQYMFSMFIKDYAGDVTFTAKKGNDALATGTVSVTQSDEWVKYEQTVTATGTENSGVTFELSFGSADSKVLIDGVKFETLDSTVGIKNYIYDPIAALSPAFFRFPGGCVIEGKTFEGAYDWKNSIGAAVNGTKDEVPELTYKLVKDGAAPVDKTTRGEQVTRKPNTDIWQPGSEYYTMEYGIGFYEYFLLCESLHASAIPIVNCGYSCQTQTPNGAIALPGRHGNGVADYIQDAIDLICFAKGSVTSSDTNEAYWAQVRTDMGHADPFEMNYIGIGNEQWGDYYTQYYEKFLENEAFMNTLEKFSVQPIVGNCTMYDHCEDPDRNHEGMAQAAANVYMGKGKIEKLADYGVVDQHYYMNYTDFLEAADLYDNYRRPDTDPTTYYDVFVGEYSANSVFTRSEGSKFSSFDYVQNSWLTALCEAAYMTGLERNGDVVKLAAYAPMFGMKDYNNQWAVDMMFFTNDDVMCTPNYYVQQLFMKNTGDYKIKTNLTGTLPQITYDGFVAQRVNNIESATTTPTSRTFDSVYYIASKDKETGDIIVKIVNVGDADAKVNIEFAMKDCTLTGLGDVTVLSGTDVTATHSDRETIKPKSHTIGGFTVGDSGTTIGYVAAKYSVTAIRLHTK